MTKAKITTPSFCPYCRMEIPEDKVRSNPDRCPECFRVIVKPENKHFQDPNYILAQKEKLLAQALIEIPGAEVGTDDYNDISASVHASEDEWYRNCLHKERVGSLSDAFEIIRHLPYSRSSGEELSQVINIAKRIGSIADHIDKFYRSGVTTYDREVRPTRTDSREVGVDQASTATGRDS